MGGTPTMARPSQPTIRRTRPPAKDTSNASAMAKLMADDQGQQQQAKSLHRARQHHMQGAGAIRQHLQGTAGHAECVRHGAAAGPEQQQRERQAQQQHAQHEMGGRSLQAVHVTFFLRRRGQQFPQSGSWSRCPSWPRELSVRCGSQKACCRQTTAERHAARQYGGPQLGPVPAHGRGQIPRAARSTFHRDWSPPRHRNSVRLAPARNARKQSDPN